MKAFPMRFFLLPILLGALGAACPAAQTGAPVDGLSQEDVAKAISALKEDFARPDALTDAEMGRATLQGLLDRLAPAVDLVSGSASAAAASPFYSETLDGKTGYLRLGALTGENVEKAKQALTGWTGENIGAVVLDLRATPASSDFDAGASLAGLFCANGTEIFSLTAGKGHVLKGADSTAQTHTFSVAADPVFKGILVVLVDSDSAEAPEAVAASLQKCTKALVVGDKTAGRAYQFTEVPLSGAVLRVAVAQVILPDGKEPGENGLTPDIRVGIGSAVKKEIMRSIKSKGVASVIDERDRPHLNEAALVSGSNPEVDELEAEQLGQKPTEPLIDRQLQRALDLVTSIAIYRTKGE